MNNSLNSAKILVTRPVLQALKLTELIKQHQGEAILFPTLEIEKLNNRQQIRAVFKNLSSYQWLIFISANAVNFALQANNGKIDGIKDTKIVAVGKATAKSLQDFGLKTYLVPEKGFNSEAVLAMPLLQDIENQKILIVRGQGGRETLAKNLTQRGAKVDYLEVYKRIMPKIDNSALINLLKQQQLSIITITSGEALDNLIMMLGHEIKYQLFEIPLIVISERIKKIAVEIGFKQVFVTENPADMAIIKTVITVCNGENSGRRSN